MSRKLNIYLESMRGSKVDKYNYPHLNKLLTEAKAVNDLELDHKMLNLLQHCIARDLLRAPEDIVPDILEVFKFCVINELFSGGNDVKAVGYILNKILSPATTNDVIRAYVVKILSYFSVPDLFKAIIASNLDINEIFRKTLLASGTEVEPETRLRILELAKSLFGELPSNAKMHFFYNTFIPITFAKENISMKVKEKTVKFTLASLVSPVVFCNAKPLTPDVKQKFIENTKEFYVSVIKKHLETGDILWKDMWCILVRALGTELHSNLEIANLLLNVTETAFRTNTLEAKLAGYHCWMTLIDNYSINPLHMCSPKHMKLIMKPLTANLSKNNEVTFKRFQVWVHFIKTCESRGAERYLEPFLNFCFGPLGTVPFLSYTQGAQQTVGKKLQAVWQPATQILLQILKHADHCKETETQCLYKQCWTFGFIYYLPLQTFAEKHELIINAVGECSVLLLEWAVDSKCSSISSCMWTSLLNNFVIASAAMADQDKPALKVAVIAAQIDAMFNIALQKTRLVPLVLIPIFNVLNKFRFFQESVLDDLVIRNCLKMVEHIEAQPSKINPDYVVAIFAYFINHTKNKNQEHLAKFYPLWCAIMDVLQKESVNFYPEMNKMFMWCFKLDRKLCMNQMTVDKWINVIKEHCNANGFLVDILSDVKPYVVETPISGSATEKTEISFSVKVLHSLVKQRALKGAPECRAVLMFLSTVVKESTLHQETVNYLREIITILLTYDQIFEPDMTTCIYNFLNARPNEITLLDVVEPYYKSINGKVKIPATLLTKFSFLSKPTMSKQTLKKIKNIISLIEFCPKSSNQIAMGIGRSAKVASLLQNTMEQQQHNNADKPPNVLFGHDINTMSPVHVRGSQLNNQSPQSKPLPPANVPPMKSYKKSPIDQNKQMPPPSNEKFVLIDTEVKFSKKNLNEHQKEMLKRRRDDIPALYNDLSQSVSQDIFSQNNSEDSSSNSILPATTSKEELATVAINIETKENEDKRKKLPTKFDFANVSKKSQESVSPVATQSLSSGSSEEKITQILVSECAAQQRVTRNSPKTSPHGHLRCSPRKNKDNGQSETVAVSFNESMSPKSKIESPKKNPAASPNKKSTMSDKVSKSIKILNHAISQFSPSDNTDISNALIDTSKNIAVSSPNNISVELESQKNTNKVGAQQKNEEVEKTVAKSTTETVTTTIETEKIDVNNVRKSPRSNSSDASPKKKSPSRRSYSEESVKVSSSETDLFVKSQSQDILPTQFDNEETKTNATKASENKNNLKMSRELKKIQIDAVFANEVNINSTGRSSRSRLSTDGSSSGTPKNRKRGIENQNDKSAIATKTKKLTADRKAMSQSSQNSSLNSSESADETMTSEENMKKSRKQSKDMTQNSECLVESSQESLVSILPLFDKHCNKEVEDIVKKSPAKSPNVLKTSLVVLDKIDTTPKRRLKFDSQSQSLQKQENENSEKSPEIYVAEIASLPTISQKEKSSKKVQSSSSLLTDEERAICEMETETMEMLEDCSQSNKTPQTITSTAVSFPAFNRSRGCSLDATDIDDLPCSPVTADTPDRTKQLLDSTIDMSPIQLEQTMIMQEEEEVAAAAELEDNSENRLDSAKETLINAELLQLVPPKDIYIEGLNGAKKQNDDAAIKTTPVTSTRSARLLNLVLDKKPETMLTPRRATLKKVGDVTPHSGSSSPLTGAATANGSSPSVSANGSGSKFLGGATKSRFFKFLEKCEEDAKIVNDKANDKETATSSIQDANLEVLKFRKEVPSPLATPEASILKRKHPDSFEDGYSPMAKRKRVNFSDPPITDTKIFFTDGDKKMFATKLAKTGKKIRIILKKPTERAAENTVSVIVPTAENVNVTIDQVLTSEQNDSVTFIDEEPIVQDDEQQQEEKEIASTFSQESSEDITENLNDRITSPINVQEVVVKEIINDELLPAPVGKETISTEASTQEQPIINTLDDVLSQCLDKIAKQDLNEQVFLNTLLNRLNTAADVKRNLQKILNKEAKDTLTGEMAKVSELLDGWMKNWF